MVSAPTWEQDLQSLLHGELAGAGFTWRLVFPSSAHPSSLLCLLAYSLSLHHQVTYPIIQDFLNISWKPKVLPVLTYAQEACKYGRNGDWWDGLGRLMLETLEEMLGKEKLNILERVRNGTALGFGDVHILTTIAKLLMLAIVWIEEQEDGALTHTFINPKSQDPALFVYLFQSKRTLSLLFHPDLEKSPGSERLPYYMIVNGPVSPWVIGAVVGPSPAQGQRTDVAQLAKEAERKVTETALSLINDWYPFGVPNEVNAPLNQFKEAVSHYQAVSRQVPNTGIEVAPLVQVLSEPPSRRKRLPFQHTLSTCRTSQTPGKLEVLTCGHSFHTACLRVYISSERRPKGVACPHCPILLSTELVKAISPKSFEEMELLKKSTIDQAHSSRASLPSASSFQCKWCQKIKSQRGTAHGCMVCFDCMQPFHFEELCRSCGQPFTEEDRLLVQVTYSK